MSTKQFKAESKRLLDLMINSIYTNKEIFLRELISNASDAIDKIYFKSLTDDKIKLKRDELTINIEIDKPNRELIISDNGCGMTREELEKNLGTIAKSGSLAFKEENKDRNEIDIIGQFGVGFYSAFMVSSCVSVYSKAYNEEQAYVWSSKGIEGYSIEPCEKEDAGTKIILKIKEDTEDEKYSNYLDEYYIKKLVKKYSDYIRYPIKMEIEHHKLKENSENEYEDIKEIETLNSMIPLWKKKKSDIKDEEYNSFYINKFSDYENPAKVIHASVEGLQSYNTLLYIPAHLPYDFYTKEYEKGLQLYSNGVLIMEKCDKLLPDYFSFVKGLVDSQDLSLNISREMLQQDRQLKAIAKSIEKKLLSEFGKLLKNNRDEYEKIFKNFGVQLKFGAYDNYGENKDKLKNLLLFYSSTEKKLSTLNEYVSRMKSDQENIYYACGETIEKIDLLPQVDGIKDKGYEILYLTENIDEFVFQVLMEYDKKKFVNVATNEINLDNKEEKERIEKENKNNEDMFKLMKETLNEQVQEVRLTNRLKNHPVCLTSQGNISVEMEKVINSMPNDQKIKAQTILEINETHPIVKKLKSLYETDKDLLKEYTKIIYSQARLIEGLSVENPTEISNLICKLISE